MHTNSAVFSDICTRTSEPLISTSSQSRLSGSFRRHIGLVFVVLCLLVSSVADALTLSAPATTASGSYQIEWGDYFVFELYETQNAPYEHTGSTDLLTYSEPESPITISGKEFGEYYYRALYISGSTCINYSMIGCIPTFSLSNAVSVKVVTSPPEGLFSPDQNSSGIYDINWEPVEGAFRYPVVERFNGGAWGVIYAGSETSITVTDKQAGTYEYRVRACADIHYELCGDFAGTVSTVVLSIPEIPGNLQVPPHSTTGNYGVSWDEVSNAEEYQVRERHNGAYWQPVYEGSDNAFEASGLSNGNYEYQVRACNSDGCSNYSSSVMVSVQASASGAVLTPPIPQLPDPGVIPASEVAETDRVGSLEGKFRVNESGAATYRVPLEIPEGTAGMAPELALEYASTGGNGILGIGWSLGGISEIVRCRQTLHQDDHAKPISFDENDRFCLNGERLVSAGPDSLYHEIGAEYKTEIDSSIRVSTMGGSPGNPGAFLVEKKDGSVTVFNSHGARKVYDQSGAQTQKVIVWKPAWIQDSSGNRVEFHYKDDDDGHRISRIEYAFGQGEEANAWLDFWYEERKDTRTNYISGYRVHDNFRLSQIKAYSNVEESGIKVFRDYRLTYKQETPVNKISRIGKIEVCSSADTCLPATEFDWIAHDVSPITMDFYTEKSFAQEGLVEFGGYQFADINGNGKQDIIWLQIEYFSSSFNVRGSSPDRVGSLT